MTTKHTPHVERRTFKAHANLIFQAIKHQAGTLSKAITEGVMNGIDAGATQIDLVCEADRVLISDNGKGFPTKEPILEFFEWFGRPHEEGDATFGFFRIGRGQMFSYGANRWRTGPFSMDVDIRENGLDYVLTDGLPDENGCTIEIDLYDHLLPSELALIERELKAAVKWVPVKVVYNGKVISRDPAEAKWDIETDDAWINTKASTTLTVYNLGVQVRAYGSYQFGVGGEVVTKKRLTLNTARNDVMGSCPVWKAIKGRLNEVAGRKVYSNSRKPLTEGERVYIARQIKIGEFGYRQGFNPKILTDVTGEHLSLSQLATRVNRWGTTAIAVAPLSDVLGDKVQQEGRGVVLAEETLERFEVDSLVEMIAVLRQAGVWIGGLEGLKPVLLADLAQDISSDYRVIPPEGLTPTEREVLEFLNYRSKLYLAPSISDGGPALTPRAILAGESGVADGWTNAQSYIVVHRRHLSGSFDAAFWTNLGWLLSHEYAHEESSEGTHVHGADFYRLFHEIVRSRMSSFVQDCMVQWPRRLEENNRKLRREVLRMLDKAVKVTKESEERLRLEETRVAVLESIASSTGKEKDRRAAKTAKEAHEAALAAREHPPIS